MTFKIAPHLAALAFASSLGPVNAQVSAPVTNFLNEPVILAQASNTARTGQMAKQRFNHMAKEVSDSIPRSMHKVDQNPYHNALKSVSPGLPEAIAQATGPVELASRHQAVQTGVQPTYLITGSLPPGGVGIALLGMGDRREFQRDFMQFYHDINGNATGRTINITRADVKSEEDFKFLQEKGALSRNAMWTGGGRYMLNGFAADRVGVQHAVTPVDPYAYLAHAKFKTENGQPDGKVVRDKNGLAVIENMDDPQLQRALIVCDPRYFGLPLDPSRQGNATPGPAASRFELQAQQPGVQPGQRPAPSTQIKF